MLKHRNYALLLAALVFAGSAACDNSSEILDPSSTVEGSELELMVDEDLTAAILADAEASLDAVTESSPAGIETSGLSGGPNDALVGDARGLLEQARQKFVEARRAWRNGDTELAAQLALEGRLLIAQAIVMVYGEEGYDDLLLRVDNLIGWLEEGVDEGSSPLLSRIRQLRQEAEDIRAEDPDSQDNLVRATERLILALQIGHRERVHLRERHLAEHARHSIFMATAAFSLAVDKVGDDATERQVYALRYAEQLRQEAIRVYGNGRYAVAFALARESVNMSLVAVLLEPGASDQSLVDWMVQVCDESIAEAEAALAGLPERSFLVDLLNVAKALEQVAIDIKEERPHLAIEILWHASITARAVVLMFQDVTAS